MVISKEQVVNALGKVVHPAFGRSIIDMSIVQDIATGENRISFSLQFENPNDPLKASIKRGCVNVLTEAFGKNVSVDIDIRGMKTPGAQEGRQVLPGVRNIIAVASGKGGVGKSTVAVNLAVTFSLAGYRVGLIDADIFGPSIPKMLGAEGEKPYAHNVGGRDLIIPVERFGVKVLSIGFFIDPEDATIWRGPMASNALRQLMSDGDWGDLDYLFIDLPPGTSDIHLTLVQTVPVTGAVIVSTPQNVALADAIKGISMFRNSDIRVPVLGLIENMSWFTPEELPEHKYYIFGKDGCINLAGELNVPFLGQIPIVQGIRESGDAGEPVALKKNRANKAFRTIAENIIVQLRKRNAELEPTRKVEIKTHRKPMKF